MNILVVDDEPDTRLFVITEYYKSLFPNELIVLEHSYTLPQFIGGFDVVSLDNDLGEFGDVVREIDKVTFVGYPDVVIHSMNPIAAKSIMLKLLDRDENFKNVWMYKYSDMVKYLKMVGQEN